jgi:hypothetical protein
MTKVTTVEIAVGHGGAEATFDGTLINAASPAELWRALGERAGERPVHLLPKNGRPNLQGQAEAALAIGSASAAVGRLRYRNGILSPRFGRSETLHYLDVPAGALLVRGAALAGAADHVARPWDACWSHDLALALSRGGVLAPADEVVAEVDTQAPLSPRLPLARAGLAVLDDPTAPYILVYGRLSASTSLYFDGVPADIAARLRFLEPGDLFSDLPWLAAASLVVIVRGFEFMIASGAINLLEEIGTPMVWFTDDDFVALGSEIVSLGYYSGDAVAAFARRMSAIGVTSGNLVEALKHYHQNVILFPCVLDADLWTARPAQPKAATRVGVFGGPFRRRSFDSHVLPAARALGLGLVVGSNLAPGQGLVETVPYRTDFRRFVLEWQRIAPAALLHPYGDTANIGNKGPGSLLAAAYLGAVPIVGREPAYEGIGEEQGVLTADPDAASWQAQLKRTLNPNERTILLDRLESWTQAAFAPELARPAFASLAVLAAPGGEAAAGFRLAAAMASRTLQRALPRQPAWRRHLARLRLSLERRMAARRRG